VARQDAFFLPPGDWVEPYVLAGEEARHLIGVLRARPGDTVRLFDGAGREGVFRIESIARREATLSPIEITQGERPDGVTLAVGWNKAARRTWLLEKAVELEARGLVFWQAARSQGAVPQAAKETWQGPMIAAAKQCGNPWLPELSTLPGGIDELVALGRTFPRRYLLWAGPEAGLFDPAEAARGDSLLVLGPEGGFTPEEGRTFSDAGFVPVSLGRRVLRLETAAVLALGLAFWARAG